MATKRGATALAALLVFVLIAVVAVTAPAPSADAQGQLACGESMSVGTTADLDAAVTCYNHAPAGTGPYTISLTANITYTGNNVVTAIAQPDEDTALTFNGNGFAIAGSNSTNVLVTVSGPGRVTFDGVNIAAGAGPALEVDEAASNVRVNFSTISSTAETAIFVSGDAVNLNLATLEVWHSSVVGGISVRGGLFGFFHSVAADAEFGGMVIHGGRTAINNSMITASGEAGLDIRGGTVVMGYSSITDPSGAGVSMSGGAPGTSGNLFMGSSTISGTGRMGIEVDAGTATFEYTTIDSFVSQPGRVGPAEVRFQNSIVTGGCVGLESVSPSSGNFVSAGAPACGDDSQELNETPLGPLADNGCSLVTPAGCVLTHALLEGSNAIDAAVGGQCGSIDQRGYRISPVPSTRQYLRPIGDGCDAGAFEFGSGVDTAPPTAPAANVVAQIEGPGTITDGGTGPVAPFGFGTTPEIEAAAAAATPDAAAASTDDPDRANISFTG